MSRYVKSMHPTNERKSIKVLVITDCSILFAGIEKILEKTQNLKLVRKNGDIEKAIKGLNNYRPDIIIIDADIFKTEELRAIDFIRNNHLPSKILLLTDKFDDNAILQFLSAGVHGFLPKWASSQDIVKAINVVNDGELWVERRFLSKWITKYSNSENSRKKLSSREEEIAALIAKGCSNKEIAANFFISEKTVKTHITNIFKKMEVDSRLKLALQLLPYKQHNFKTSPDKPASLPQTN